MLTLINIIILDLMRSKLELGHLNQSSVLKTRENCINLLKNIKKYPNENNVPRPKHWSGWNLKPDKIEFWFDGENRIHQRLKYDKKKQ